MGAVVLYSFHIHFFPLRECRSAGAVVLYSFHIHFFPLGECGTAGALVLHSFHIHFFPTLSMTAGLREPAINVTQSWRGILKLLWWLNRHSPAPHSDHNFQVNILHATLTSNFQAFLSVLFTVTCLKRR